MSAKVRDLFKPSAKLSDAAILAAGAGLMFAGLARIEDPRTIPVRSPAALMSVGGAALLLYGSYRVSPSFGAASAALLFVAGAVNEHRRSLGLEELPLPGLSLRDPAGSR